MLRPSLAAALACTLGCFKNTSTSQCMEGSEGCECSDGRCLSGLVCRDNACVAEASTAATTTDVTDGSGSFSSSATATTDPTTTGTNTSTTGGSADSSSTGSTTLPSDSGTTQDLCGNHILDPGEMCDNTNGCNDDCTLENFVCNPMNNVGCAPSQKCAWRDPTTILCIGQVELGEFGADTCFYDGYPHDEDCDVGMACVVFQSTNTCDGGGCCEEYCDLGDPSFVCTTPGNTCQPAYGSPPFEPGLEWLGLCLN